MKLQATLQTESPAKHAAVFPDLRLDPCAPLDGLHAAAENIFQQALAQCSIDAAFDRQLRFEGDTLLWLSADPLLAESKLCLGDFKRVFIVAIGKAALPMMNVLLERMPRRRGLRGICCGPSIPTERNWRIRYFAGGHPLPNKDSFAAARATLQMLRRAKKDTLVLFLISGGGSAMFELPLDEAISLEDTRAFHQCLLASGGAIAEINTIRKHFSAVKGGRLAAAASDATKISLLLPDVPLRHLDALASSPTMPDSSTNAQTMEVLERYQLLAKFPESIRNFFLQQDLPEAPSNEMAAQVAGRKATLQGQARSMFATLLTSDDLVSAAGDRARVLGYEVVIDNSCDDWNYADAARYLLERFHRLRRQHPRLCLISAGEVTVELSDTPGVGGRNQQFALTCALDLARFEGERLAVFSAGSDGVDGNSHAAGAIVDTTTNCRARAYGFDPEDALRRYDTCPLFTALGDTVVTGPTNHNLRDLRLLIADSPVQ